MRYACTPTPRALRSVATGVARRHGDLLDRGLWQDLGCDGLFCPISAEPATGWLTEVALDPDGSIWTDRDLESIDLGVAWELIGRSPVPFETSIPGVFAAGDARSGAVKRVAASVGEGASAVKSVHRILVP